MTPSTILIISFFIVTFALSKPVYKVTKKSLDKHCNNIEKEIDNSHQEVEKSQNELSAIVNKNNDIENTIAQILNTARLEAKLIANKEEKELAALAEQRLEQEKNRILYRNSLAIQELKEQIINISTDCTYKLTTLKLNNEKNQLSTVNFAIEQIPNKIH
ncbi:MAG: ATP synthase F0 subunit B [Rickettsiaceae bacterium H1]|nr:ATP synthase F0 subunit B [Rickettsiaceae bacterium H1]